MLVWKKFCERKPEAGNQQPAAGCGGWNGAEIFGINWRFAPG